MLSVLLSAGSGACVVRVTLATGLVNPAIVLAVTLHPRCFPSSALPSSSEFLQKALIRRCLSSRKFEESLLLSVLRCLLSFTGWVRNGLDRSGDVSLKCRKCTYKHTVFITGAGSRKLVRDRPQQRTNYVYNVINPNRGVLKPFPCDVTNIYQGQLVRICNGSTSESIKTFTFC